MTETKKGPRKRSFLVWGTGLWIQKCECQCKSEPHGREFLSHCDCEKLSHVAVNF